MKRREFLKTMAAIPAAVLSVSPGLDGLLSASSLLEEGYPVEIQIEDTQFFRPDGFYGACPDPDNDWIFRLHYVRDDVEHLEFYRYGVWVVGDSGLPRVVVMDKL